MVFIGNKSRKKIKTCLILLAALLGLLSIAAGEDTADPAMAETVSPVVKEAATEGMPTESDGTPSGQILPLPSDTGENPEPAEEETAEATDDALAQPVLAPSTDIGENPEPAEEATAEATDDASAQPVQDPSSDTGESQEPAEEATAEATDDTSAQPAVAPSSDTGEGSEPTEEATAEAIDDTSAQPAPDPSSDTDESPEPAEEATAEATDDASAQPAAAPSSDTGESPEEAEDEESDECEETPEDALQWDGILQVDAICDISMDGSKLYCLTLPCSSDLVLTASGIPVKITLALPQSDQMRIWESEKTEEPDVFDIHASLSLEKGEYSVAIEPLQENQKGLVAVCFSNPIPAAEEPETDLLREPPAGEAEPLTTEETNHEPTPDAETPARQSDRTGTEAAGETEPAAETSEPDTLIPEKEKMPLEVYSGEEAKEDPETIPGKTEADLLPESAEEEAPDTEPLPEEKLQPDAVPDDPKDADSAESAAEPIIIQVSASCEGAFQPGARITLTAVVSDQDYQGTIRWQYSPDGGVTACDIADVAGTEYSFILDKVNETYLWRAYLE